MEAQERIRILELAWELAKTAQKPTQSETTWMNQYLEKVDNAYKAIAKTVASE
ncbi:hypothetical protein ACFLUD_00750 [Chloroflexota bacterium]